MDSPQQQINIKEILELLPHRYPFVMVDRIVSFKKGESITGLKNVTMNEPFFQGHFPGEPVMPGVMILEGMAQVAAILAYLSVQDQIGEKLVYFAGIDGVRFRRRVIPGDQLILEATLVKHKQNIWKMAAKAIVENNLVTEAELMASFV